MRREVNDAGKMAVGLEFSSASRHDIGVQVNGINGIRDGYYVIDAKDLLNIAAVTFGTVADEDFIPFHPESAARIIMFNDGVDEKIVALFRAVAAEALLASHFGHGFFHGGHGSGRKRQRHVTDAEANDLCLGMGVFECGNAAGDLSKQVIARQLEIIFVNIGHATGTSSGNCRFLGLGAIGRRRTRQWMSESRQKSMNAWAALET